jgi:hypothetical protein
MSLTVCMFHKTIKLLSSKKICIVCNFSVSFLDAQFVFYWKPLLITIQLTAIIKTSVIITRIISVNSLNNQMFYVSEV